MKRIIIIAGIFIALIGVVVGLQFLPDSHKDSSGQTVGASTFDVLVTDYEAAWQHEKGWNKTLFDAEMEELDGKHRFGNISEQQKEQLTMNVCNYALNKVDSLLRHEWQSANCRRNVVSKNYACLASVEAQRCLNGDCRIKELKNMYGTYNSINSLIDNILNHPTFGVSAGLDSEGCWADFSKRITYVDALVTQNRNNAYYRNYFSKINTVRSSLESAPERYSKIANHYYELVVSNLESRYDELYKDVETSGNVAALDNYSSALISTLNALKTDCQKCDSKAYTSFQNFANSKKMKIADLKNAINE
mgnify:CR=1 FL=1